MTHEEIRELIRTNGFETEALSCIEELSELQKEITKAMRNKNGDRYAESNIDDMISEIADVLITIDILKLLFHIHDNEIDYEIHFKEKRIKERYLSKKDYNIEQLTIGLYILSLANIVMLMFVVEANDKLKNDVSVIKNNLKNIHGEIFARLEENEDNISELRRMQEGTSDVVVRMIESNTYSKRENDRHRSMTLEMYNDYSKYKSYMAKIRKYMEERENEDETVER